MVPAQAQANNANPLAGLVPACGRKSVAKRYPIAKGVNMSDEPMNGDDMSDAEAEAIERRNRLIREFGQEVCDAAREVFGKADWQSELEAGAYLGWYGELAAYAEAYLEDAGEMLGWPGLAKDYFDYAAYGRDLERNGVIGEHNGHIFNTNL